MGPGAHVSADGPKAVLAAGPVQRWGWGARCGPSPGAREGESAEEAGRGGSAARAANARAPTPSKAAPSEAVCLVTWPLGGPGKAMMQGTRADGA